MVESLMDAEAGTPEGDTLDVMTDLEPFIGSSGRVSEVLNRRRPLTLPMIRRLERGLGIPARILVQEPKSTDRAGRARTR
jgi:hypothetical protein